MPRSLALGVLLAIGLACTVFGGFVGGRRAGALQTRHGALVGLVAIMIALSTLLFASVESQDALGPDLLGALLSVPAGMLGGYVAERISADTP